MQEEDCYEGSSDYSDEGCGEGFSCDECDNYGCSAHPYN
jgi:hypothetical protein